jgi:predicted SnoaL-like aldol condensation-catalyzing enzyme
MTIRRVATRPEYPRDEIPRIELYPGGQAPDGPEGFLEISNAAVSQHPRLRQDVKRITADGDLVMAHSLIKFSPEDRGTAVVDILRFEHGKIVEHWDVRQSVPEATASGNPFI